MGLKIWTYDFGDGEFFVAETAGEANALYEDWCGTPLSAEHGEDPPKWEPLDASNDLTITLEDGFNGLEAGRHTKSVAEWIQWNGKGYLFSRNYLP